MHTYSIRAAITKTTGHYRRPGTMTTYCTGAPTDLHANTSKMRRMCTRCVKAEARDRAHAEAVAAQHATPLTEWERDLLASDTVRDAIAAETIATLSTPTRPTAADRAAAAEESRYAAELITEAEATEGTWRGQWIGARDTGPTLFALPTADQGALFA
ncbi:hypothetical protein [Streptomyces sp. NBC_01217]|uniref:hypothetical protein n=1 Tax=Streptomyces sp. NBC_01217 TaxID=2903779 RepID=UPI002E141089|nr:hypothetical protein OG507_21035 [Streptomyces sp. NBC_01217]